MDFHFPLSVYIDRCCRWERHLLRDQERKWKKSVSQRRHRSMTKFLATIMVLLHLCFSVQANRDIHLEMVKGLQKLNLLYRQNKTNVSFVSNDECFWFFSPLVIIVSKMQTGVLNRLSSSYWPMMESLKYPECHKKNAIFFFLPSSQRQWMYPLQKCRRIRYVLHLF